MSIVNRGRDVYRMIETRGEQGMKEALVKLAEDNTMLHQEMQSMQEMLRRVTQQLALQLGVMKEMDTMLSKHEAKFNPDNEANPNQKWS